MLNITLLDGKKLQFPGKVNGHEIAKTISPSLAKKALVIKVNDSFKDLSSFIEKDSTVQIITIEDDYGLEVIRHDTAHVLAMAVQELFKDTQVTIGTLFPYTTLFRSSEERRVGKECNLVSINFSWKLKFFSI